MTKITQTYIDKLKPTGARFEKSLQFGLYIAVSAKGVKSYCYKYSDLKTKARRKKNIANANITSLEDACKMAISYNSLLKQGIDPFVIAKEQDDKAKLQKMTLCEIMGDWREVKGRHLSPKHLRDRISRFNNHLAPILGDLPIAEISLFKAREMIKPIYDEKAHIGEKIARDLREMGDYAVEMGILENNHLSLIKKAFPRPKVTHQPRIKAEELPQFMKDLIRSRMDYITRYLIEFQLLTMVRANEVVTAEWAHIDFINARWNIPPENMKMKKAHSVPLSTQALEILHELQKFTGHLRYIFAGHNDKNAHYSSNTANQAFKRLGYKGRMTPHGMRGLARTYLADKGVAFEVAESCLAHETGGSVSKSYNSSNYFEQRIAVMQLWGDFIEQCKKQ